MGDKDVLRRQIIVDVESTSLVPDYETGSGVIWELSAMKRGAGRQHLWRVKPNLARADPAALRVGQFYERTDGMLSFTVEPNTWDLAHPASRGQTPYWSSPALLAAIVAPMLDDAVLIAANPTFDAGFIAAFLRYYGQAPTWHYRLRDIGSMAYGYLCSSDNPGFAVPPIDASTDEFAVALGVDPGGFQRHTALGDCLMAAAMLDVIEGGAS